MPQQSIPLDIIAGFAALLVLPSAIWYRFYLRLHFGKCLLFGLLAGVGAFVLLMPGEGRSLFASPLVGRDWMMREPFILTPFMILVGLGLGILVKVYRALALDKATDMERTPNARAFRAWLGPMNVIAGAGVVASAYYALGWRPWLTAAAVLAILLVNPVFHILLKQPEDNRPEDESVAERQRVLSLVESGKITAADGAELLSALSQSYSVGTYQNEDHGITKNRRMMLLGAVIVLVGFFLPWLSVNVGAKMTGMMRTFVPDASLPLNVIPQNMILRMNGGDIAHGLGWFIMLLALAVAVMPLVWPTRPANRQTQRGITLVALGVGSILVLYIFSGFATAGAGVDLEAGLFLVILGYAILWTWTVREYLLGTRRANLSSVAIAP